MGARPEDSLSSALERICFLEWRLEQMEAVVADERTTVKDLRERIAEGAQREADAARRVADLEDRLAEASREMIAVSDRSAHADAERSLLERRMQSSGRDTSREMAELCRKLEREQERAEQKSKALDRARDRLAALERARESFFARLIEWQKMTREDDVDLAEFIAELRAEIARLASENEEAQAREESLLDRLSKSQPPVPSPQVAIPRFLAPSMSMRPQPESSIGLKEASAVLDAIEGEAKRNRAQRLAGDLAGDRKETRMAAARALVEVAGPLAAPLLAAAVRAACDDEERIAFLEQLGRTRAKSTDGPAAGSAELARMSIESAIDDANPLVRAAAFEAKLALAPVDEVQQIAREGLADRDPRVRRRLMLSVRTAAGDHSAELLLPLVSDPDPQARRTACAALAGQRTPEVMKALAGALDDEVEGVRTAAAQSLATMRWEMRHGAR